jgi:ABC-2 type transport system ATP-binding protein
MISTEDLCFDYPQVRALDHVSIQIPPNTITALVGPNGAGKTTLLRCLSALDSPTTGKVTIDQWDADRFPRKVHELCCYLPDFFGLYDELTVTQNLRFSAMSHGLTGNAIDTAIEDAVQQLHLAEYREATTSTLSRGLRQRLAIAQTIIHKPKILFLDEPAAGLDPKARYDLSQLLLSLQKQGLTLIVSSHILAELQDYSTHMMVMQKGKVLEYCEVRGNMQELYLKISETKD